VKISRNGINQVIDGGTILTFTRSHCSLDPFDKAISPLTLSAKAGLAPNDILTNGSLSIVVFWLNVTGRQC
jgi:hypothetical protein